MAPYNKAISEDKIMMIQNLNLTPRWFMYEIVVMTLKILRRK